jgi:hypothetical protein
MSIATFPWDKLNCSPVTLASGPGSTIPKVNVKFSPVIETLAFAKGDWI